MRLFNALLISIGLAGTLIGPALAEPATAFQQNPRHDGATLEQPFLPLLKRWELNIPNPSYPIIAQGKVFVTAGYPDNPRPEIAVWAFDGLTGRPAWSRPVALDSRVRWAAPAYENGMLFVLDETGLLQAITAETGQLRWKFQLPTPADFKSPPVALNGRVYISRGDSLSGAFYVISAQSGRLIQSQPAPITSYAASPAVTPTAVYFANRCPDAYRFTADLKQVKWHYGSPNCNGPGVTPVVAGRTLYVRDQIWPNPSLFKFDAVTGHLMAALYGGGPPPAIRGNQLVFLNEIDRRLEARRVDTDDYQWLFSGDGGLITAPIIAGDWVFVGSESGTLFALDIASGHIVWQASVDVPFDRVEEGGVYAPRGLAVADGLLVLPTARRITVYHWDK